MIRLRTSPLFPKHIYKDRLFGIISKNTILGVHRKNLRSDVDSECSKTMLILSNNRRIIEDLLGRFEERHTWGIGFERNLENNVIMLPSDRKTFAPLYIEQFDFPDLEKICCFHNFDMYIVFNIKDDNSNYPPDIYLDGYEHTTNEWPQRSIVERYMRDMLCRD